MRGTVYIYTCTVLCTFIHVQYCVHLYMYSTGPLQYRSSIHVQYCVHLYMYSTGYIYCIRVQYEWLALGSTITKPTVSLSNQLCQLLALASCKQLTMTSRLKNLLARIISSCVCAHQFAIGIISTQLRASTAPHGHMSTRSIC